MLNWIIWNITIFHIETVLTLNWIVGNRAVWLNWIALNRKVFDNKTLLMLNWIVWNRTVSLYKMDLTLNDLKRLISHKNQTNKPKRNW